MIRWLSTGAHPRSGYLPSPATCGQTAATSGLHCGTGESLKPGINGNGTFPDPGGSVGHLSSAAAFFNPPARRPTVPIRRVTAAMPSTLNGGCAPIRPNRDHAPPCPACPCLLRRSAFLAWRRRLTRPPAHRSAARRDGWPVGRPQPRRWPAPPTWAGYASLLPPSWRPVGLVAPAQHRAGGL